MRRAVVPSLAFLAAAGFVFTSRSSATFLVCEQPIALLALVAVVLCGGCSIVFVRGADPRWDEVAVAAAEVAACAGLMALAGGVCWSRATRGTWWTWDELLTLTLLVWLEDIGYLLVRRFAGAGADRLAAGLAVFAVVAMPFIYVIVDRGIPNVHATDMAWSSTQWLVSLATFAAGFAAWLILRVDLARAERSLRELRERARDGEIEQ